MLMTGFGMGSVEVERMALNPTNNLTTDVDIRHKGDSVSKTIPFEEFTHDNFENMSQWLHGHGTPEELHQDHLCYEVV